MRLVLIGPVYPFRGGIAHHTTELFKALALHHEVLIISFKRQYPKLLYPGVSDKDSTIKNPPISTEYILDPIKPWTWFKTIRCVINFSPDGVLFQWWNTFVGMAYYTILRSIKNENIPVIIIVHNVYPHETLVFDKIISKKILKLADIFIAQSHRELQKLKKILPYSIIQYCRHPAYDFFLANCVDKNKARDFFHLDKDSFVILFFGIIRPYKGLKYLLQAIKHLKDQNINLTLLIAGEFWENKQKYMHQIEQLNILDRVMVLDKYFPDEEVSMLFSAADVFVAPYISGTQSGVVRIAVSFGLPIILSDVIKDSIEPQSNHIVVPTRCYIEIANAIKYYIANKSETLPIPKLVSWDDLAITIENSFQKL